MAEIKVSLQQNTQSINAGVYQNQQSVSLGIEQGVINKVFHDDTLKGSGTPYDLLGLSDEILEKIDSGGSTFIFDFDASQTSWEIIHNLNKRPSVTVVDSAGAEVEKETEYLDNNTVRITFNAPFKGQAYLN